MFAYRWAGPCAFACFLLFQTGCGAPAHNTDEKYYLVAANIKVPYWQLAQAGFNHAIAEMRVVKGDIAGPDTYDPKGESQEFQRVVREKPAGILVSAADAAAISGDIDAAIGQGIPVITIDSDASTSKRLFFVGTDNYKAGIMGGQLVTKLLNGKGNVVVFTIPDQANLKQRLSGYQDAFADRKTIQITEQVDMKGDPTVAFDAAKRMIDSKSKVDAFVCLEAIACPEVADVVSRENMSGKIKVVAMDTDQRTLNWIQKGVISATIAQKPFTMGYYGLKLVDDLHHHKPSSLTLNFAQDPRSPVPEFVDTGASLIDKNNVAALMQEGQTSGPATK